jgi:hypothetical protein
MAAGSTHFNGSTQVTAVIDDEENEAMEVVSLFLKLSWFP